jgi:HPt (histidine-containing phosphotransfer) domain-containing protein
MDVSTDMRFRYFQRRVKDYSDCLGAVRIKNPEPIYRIGHQLRGNAESYGFIELARVGQKLEEAARKGDWDQVVASLGDFETILCRG